MNKNQRDMKVIQLIKTFKVCSRDQIAYLLFNKNSNPINVCNRVLKRLTNEGKVKQIKRTKDQCYLYTLNPSPIRPNSNKINHHLKILDTYIYLGCPKKCVLEPKLGAYNPDMMIEHNNEIILIEVQLTQISKSKMNEKINSFISEYNKTHNSKTLHIYSNYNIKNTIKNGFKIFNKNLPKDIKHDLL